VSSVEKPPELEHVESGAGAKHSFPGKNVARMAFMPLLLTWYVHDAYSSVDKATDVAKAAIPRASCEVNAAPDNAVSADRAESECHLRLLTA